MERENLSVLALKLSEVLKCRDDIYNRYLYVLLCK